MKYYLYLLITLLFLQFACRHADEQTYLRHRELRPRKKKRNERRNSRSKNTKGSKKSSRSEKDVCPSRKRTDRCGGRRKDKIFFCDRGQTRCVSQDKAKRLLKKYPSMNHCGLCIEDEEITKNPERVCNSSTVSAELGGSVSLQNVAVISFEAGSFARDATISVCTDAMSEEMELLFEQTATMFRPSARMSNEIVAIIDAPLVATGSGQASLVIPDGIAQATGSTEQVEAMLLLDHSSNIEESYPIFSLLESSTDTQGNIIVDVPANAFRMTASGLYEATLNLSPTPGKDTSNQRRLGLPEQCQAASIHCPLDECILTHPFDDVPFLNNHSSTHYGADYKALPGDNVYAVADGTVEISRSSLGTGETIVLRHRDESATLYGHLSQRSVAAGTNVTVGQKIGEAGDSGLAVLPHLHLEYVPNGLVSQNKNRIDPHPCIGNVVAGSITAGDSGSVADDSFELSIDGFIFGRTRIGAIENLSFSRLRPGVHVLTVKAVEAPDDTGTYYVKLSDGITFDDGGTVRDHTMVGLSALKEGESISWNITVPDDTDPLPQESCQASTGQSGVCLDVFECFERGWAQEASTCNGAFQCCFEPKECRSSTGVDGRCLNADMCSSNGGTSDPFGCTGSGLSCCTKTLCTSNTTGASGQCLSQSSCSRLGYSLEASTSCAESSVCCIASEDSEEGTPPDPKSFLILDPPKKFESRNIWGSTGYNENGTFALLKPIEFTIHHTATDPLMINTNMTNIQAQHKAWANDIGYHFLIDNTGTVYQGRPFFDDLKKVANKTVERDRYFLPTGGFNLVNGAHVEKANAGKIGISLFGCYDPKDTACTSIGSTEIAEGDSIYQSLIHLLAWLSDMFDIPLSADTVKPHSDFGGTTCPGRKIEDLLKSVIEDSTLLVNNGGTLSPVPCVTSTGVAGTCSSWFVCSRDGFLPIPNVTACQEVCCVPRTMQIPQPNTRWENALMNCPRSVSSRASEVQAANDAKYLDRILLDHFREAAQIYDLPAAFIAAIASRESSMGTKLRHDGYNHEGTKFGVMQVPVDMLSNATEDSRSREHVLQAVSFLKDQLLTMDCDCGSCECKDCCQSQQGIVDWILDCKWEDCWLLRGSLIANQVGIENVCSKRGLDDNGVYSTDYYSSDVIARAQWYFENIPDLRNLTHGGCSDPPCQDHSWLSDLEECNKDRTYCAWGKNDLHECKPGFFCALGKNGEPAASSIPLERSFSFAESSNKYLLTRPWLLERMRKMSVETDIPLPFLLSLGSRESAFGRVLPGVCLQALPPGNSTLGNCGGYGLYQLDRTYWGSQIKEAEAAEGERGGPLGFTHMRQALKYFKRCYTHVRDKFASGENLDEEDKALGLEWTSPYILKGAAVCYNSGGENVRSIVRMDNGTTEDDYGSDFMTQAQWFYDNGYQ